MEQSALEQAAKAFADALEEEKVARELHTACQALLDKSMCDSMDARKARYEAERQLLEVAHGAASKTN